MMGSKVGLGDIRGLLVDADKRPLLRLLPQMDEVCRGYALAHLGDAGYSIEGIAEQVWLLNATDWMRGVDKLSWSLYKKLNHSGFSRVLHEFAMKIAEDFLRDREKQGQKVLKESWDLLQIKRKWMEGQVSDKELDNARNAFRDADWAAYWAAYRAANWDADWAADLAANWDADWAAYWAADRVAYAAAYWAASRIADWAAHGAAVQKGQMDLLGDMLEDSVGIQRGVEEKSLESKVLAGGL